MVTPSPFCGKAAGSVNDCCKKCKIDIDTKNNDYENMDTRRHTSSFMLAFVVGMLLLIAFALFGAEPVPAVFKGAESGGNGWTHRTDLGGPS